MASYSKHPFLIYSDYDPLPIFLDYWFKPDQLSAQKAGAAPSQGANSNAFPGPRNKGANLCLGSLLIFCFYASLRK